MATDEFLRPIFFVADPFYAYGMVFLYAKTDELDYPVFEIDLAGETEHVIYATSVNGPFKFGLKSKKFGPWLDGERSIHDWHADFLTEVENILEKRKISFTLFDPITQR